MSVNLLSACSFSFTFDSVCGVSVVCMGSSVESGEWCVWAFQCAGGEWCVWVVQCAGGEW